MTAEDANDYDKVHIALLREFRLTADAYQAKFRAAKRSTGETFSNYVERLKKVLRSWMTLAKKEETWEGLYDLVIQEQFFAGIPSSVMTYVKTAKVVQTHEMVELAQAFVDARPQIDARGGEQKEEHRSERNKEQGFNSSGGQRGKWRKKPYEGPNREGSSQSTSDSTKPNSSNVSSPVNRSDKTEPKAVTSSSRHLPFHHLGPGNCWKCGKPGHVARQCVGVVVDRSKMKKDEISKNVPEGCAIHNSLCEDCIVRTQGETFESTAKVDGRPCVVWRDTGCRGIVISNEMAIDAEETGRTRELEGVFPGVEGRTVCPLKIVHLDSCYITTRVVVAVAPPLHVPVLIGNYAQLPSGESVEIPVYGKKKSVVGVVTRAQQKKEDRGPAEIVVPEPVSGKTVAEVLHEQENDPKLERLWTLARNQMPPKQQGKGKVRYIVRKGLLQREYTGVDGVDHRQLVVPTSLKNEVIRLAHDPPMAGHLGVRRTTNRIWTEFYWPGMCNDIRRYVRSCDACQRTVAKGSVRPVMLERMPVVDVPFKRVGVDIIGPIHPPSDRGHRFVLVQVDYATRYPEAVPLKNIEATTVAEAMWGIWTRVGIPERVLSDNGSQFRGVVMKELYKLLSINGMFTSPYHAQCNGLVERFNGTLKQMLKRLCTEQPKEWDRYIPACLFAYREVPHESLKYSPFELLYGRAVRGPLQVLKQLWTKQGDDTEERLASEYVIDLKDRITETCNLAKENLVKATERHAKVKDVKAVNREFAMNDEVLLLLPMKRNKLEVSWRGPYRVLERLGPCNYKIQVARKRKVFHVNLLKKYTRRENIPELVAEVIDEEGYQGIPVVDEAVNKIPLVPLNAEEGPEDVTICEGLGPKPKEELEGLCREFGHRFTDLPAKTNLEECEILLTSETPVRVRQYPLPHSAMDCIRKEVQDMLKLGVIEACSSPYSAPLVLVKKPDGKMRTCQDFRKLNQVVRFDAEPLPDVEHLFSCLGKAQFLSKIDLTKGYWQIPVRLEDRHKTAFTTPQGQFQWVTMPFGLKTAGAIFSRMMRKLIDPIQNANIRNFVDDVLVATETWQEHLIALRQLLVRMTEANIVARPKKCFFGFSEVTFLGHRVGKGCMKPEEEKVKKFQAMEVPTTKKEVRRYLGALGFYRRYVKNYSSIALPLTDLTKGPKMGPITWTEECQAAFDQLKQALVTQPVLHLPDESKPFVLRTDASDIGLGAVLLQESGEGRHPVGFASKKLGPAERNYSTIEKECFAIVWSIRRFEPYLYGRHFVVETDHHPLQYLQQSRPHSGRLARWAMQLQAYAFTVRTIAGSENVDADFWSRLSQDL